MSVRISVIFPLTEERGLTEQAVAGWVKQTLPPELTELVLVSAAGAVLPRSLTALLRPRDPVVTGRFDNIDAIFDAGIRAASGEFVFLTESHCLPAPDCLEATDRFLVANSHLAGACTHSVASCENAYARIDADTFYEGFREFVRPGDWRKLNVHGFAMKRAVYLALGGFQHRYGRFAEMLLAASLRDAGHELGYAEEAIITHHYRGRLGELIEGIDDYVRGETLYRADHPGRDRVGYTYLPEVADPRQSRVAALEREVAGALLSGVFGKSTAVAGQGLRIALRSAARIPGRYGSVAVAWLGVVAARVRCWRYRNDAKRLDKPYRELFRRAAALSRVRALASFPLDEDAAPRCACRVSVEDFPQWATYGFHGTEWWQGRPFRWSSPLAALQLALRPDTKTLRLVTRGLRAPCYPLNLRVALNGIRIEPRPLPNGDYELPVESRHLRVRLHTLLLMSDPLCPWDEGVLDHRELGLPLFAVESDPFTEVRTAHAA